MGKWFMWGKKKLGKGGGGGLVGGIVALYHFTCKCRIGQIPYRKKVINEF